MTVEIRNPAKLPMDLNLAEKEFVRCLAEGQPCIVGNGELPDVPIVSGDGANVVRGEVIRFFAYGGNGENPVLDSVISLRGAWISGVLNLMHASIPYVLDFINCHFDDDVDMPHAECAGLYLHGSRLVRVLRADGLTTKGNVYLRNGFSAKGAVRLLGANIGGDLDCMGGKFYNPGGIALSADGLATKGSVILSNGFFVEGGVRLVSASIGINLDCRGGKFYNSDGIALAADGLATKGSVILSNGFFAKGEVGLLHANIGGSLNCVGGKFHNPDGMALSADGLTTKGDVNLRNDFSAEGEVRLVSASIGINLDCEGGKFHNPKGCALSANDLTTKGSVILSNGFSAEGEVELLRADIGRNLFCEGGKFHNPDGKALVVEAGNISGGLFWRDTICEGDVNLAYAKVDVLVDDSAAWKSCKVALDAFTYSRFANPVDAQSRIDWLARRPDKMGFSPLPYEQAAKALRAVGKDIDAWDIEREKRELERTERDAGNSFKILGWRRLWGRAIDELTNFVYRPWRTFGWAIAIVCVSAFLFNFADEQGRMVPHQPIVLANTDYQAEASSRCAEFQCLSERRPTAVVRRLFPDYPAFSPLAFSLDVFIPFFALHQELFWAPASGDGDTFWMLLFPPTLFLILLGVVMFFAWLFQHWRRSRKDGVFTASAAVGMAAVSLEIAIAAATGVAHVLYDAESVLWLVDGQRLTIWYWLEIGTGWVLTSLFLLSVTGLLRPRQSSSERD